MLGEHAAHDVPVDVDAERARDDARDPWAAEPRIARLELDDGADECLTRTLRTGLSRMRVRREEAAILATYQRRMKSQERRGTHGNSELADAAGTEEERPESAEQPVARHQIGRSPATPTQHEQLLLEHEILGDHRADATKATQLCGHDGQVQQREEQVRHVRASLGQTLGVTQRCPT